MRTVAYSDDHDYQAARANAYCDTAAITKWQDWAHRVLRQGQLAKRFGERTVRIWAAYARGDRYSQIATAEGVSKRRVSWAIALVLASVLPAPCPNPWRRTEKYAPPRDPRFSYYRARRKRRAAAKQSTEPQEDDFWLT